MTRHSRLALRVGLVLVAVFTVAGWLGFAIGRVTDAPPSPSAIILPTAPPPPTVEPRVTSRGGVVDVPASIDATGGSDVTEALQAFIDATPDDTTIRFPPGARYLLDHTLEVEGRRQLTLDGQGATLQATRDDADPDRALLRLRSSRDIVVRSFSLRGDHPDPGTWVPGFEWQHAISVEGGGDIEVADVDIRGQMGDCVYVTSDLEEWASGVWVHDSSCHESGRQGVAVVAGRDVRVERMVFGTIALSVLDLEPDPKGVVPQGVERVVFVNNTVDGPVGDKLFNATGVGPISDVLVQGNVMAGASNGIWSLVVPLDGSPRYRNVAFLDNVADGAFDGRQHPVLLFVDVDGLEVSGNRQRIDSAYAAIRIVRSCDVEIGTNDLAPVSTVDVESGPCP